MNKELFPQTITPEKERRGIQHIGVSTSGWLSNPEQLFEHMDRVNEERAKNGKKGLIMEIYPTYRPKSLNRAAEVTGMIPPTVDSDYVIKQLSKYPGVIISLVHLEFNLDCLEEIKRLAIGEEFFPSVPGNVPVDRLVMGFKQRFYQGVFMVVMGPAEKNRGVNMAKELHSEIGKVGISAHPNVIEGFALRYELDNIMNGVAFTYAENERPFGHSPHMGRFERMGVKSKEAVSDPEIILREIVERYRLDGLVYGADHIEQTRANLVEKYLLVAKAVRVIHVAGSEAKNVHTLPKTGNSEMEELLTTATSTYHNNDLAVILDVSPLVVKKMSQEDQLNVIRSFTSWIEKMKES